MSNFSKFLQQGDVDDLAVVVAFDPGGTTGWCAMAVEPQWFTNAQDGIVRDSMAHIEYGQIDCDPPGLGLSMMHQGHPGLNMAGEKAGVKKMLSLCDFIFPKATIVLEDFIPDFKKMDQARHTLSPVRIISAFSYGLDEDLGASDFSRIHIQNRSLAKTTCTDVRLRHWGLFDSGSGGHARDATRHAYYFLKDARGHSVEAAERRWRGWPHLFGDPQYQASNTGRTPRQSIRDRPLGERI